nr:hypothetical protein [Tanacetum cinerariifolium]
SQQMKMRRLEWVMDGYRLKERELEYGDQFLVYLVQVEARGTLHWKELVVKIVVELRM